MPPAHYGPFLLKKGIYLVGGGGAEVVVVGGVEHSIGMHTGLTIV